jgi:inositol phosphorylceramide glucuronosyltransferase 1
MIQNASKKRAYASLLYGEEFVLGIRVLGQSILEASTGTTNADLVALVAGKISDSTLKLLRDDGWIVKQSDIVSNPTAVHPKKFSGVYTKLLLFGEFS